MQIELESANRNNRKKIIIIIVLTVLIIIMLSLLGIYAANMYNIKYISKQKEINGTKKSINIIKQNNTNQITNTEVKEQKEEKKLPQYTEEAKKKMKNIYNSEKKIAYLTFDDGPSKAVTPLILDLLKKENIKATFFVLGSSVNANKDILQREYNEGHYIANHGYSHQYSKIYKSEQEVLNEYNKTEKIIKNALGIQEYSSHLFRFPGGSNGGKYSKLKSKAKQTLHENNISFIDWNCLTKDAEGIQTKESIIENLKKTSDGKNSLVILMHDAETKILTYETLQDVINYLREQGYEFDNFYSIMK